MAVTQAEVIKLYVATFKRAPDAAGLEYWTNSSGLNIEGIASSFFDQPETQTLYPEGISTSSFINAVYQNLFNRNADAGGLQYWGNAIDSGVIQKSVFIQAVINGALNSDVSNDATILENKKTVAQSFVEKGLNDTTLAKQVIEAIDESQESVNSSLNIINNETTISDIVSDGLYAGTYHGVNNGYFAINVYDDTLSGYWYNPTFNAGTNINANINQENGTFSTTGAYVFDGVFNGNIISGDYIDYIDHGFGTFQGELIGTNDTSAVDYLVNYIL